MAKKKKSNAPKITPDNSGTVGIFILLGSVIVLLSLVSFGFGQDTQNLLGLAGHSIGWIFHALLGLGSYLLTLFMGWVGLRMTFHKPIHSFSLKTLCVSVLIISFCMLLSLIENQYPSFASFLGNIFYSTEWKKKHYFHLGGAPFYYIYRDLPALNFLRLFNNIGTVIIFSSTLLASSMLLFKINPKRIFEIVVAWMEKINLPENPFKRNNEPVEPAPIDNSDSDFMRYVKLRTPEGQSLENSQQEMLGIQPEVNLKVRPSISRKEQQPDFEPIPPKQPKAYKIEPDKEKEPFKEPAAPKEKEIEKTAPLQKKREAALTAQKVYNGDFTNYKLPSISLLTHPKKVDQTSLKKDLKRQAEVLEETLLSFGIEAKVGQINCGPTITSFEVHPAIGVKVQKIKALEDDIALNMEAKSIRIIAPIPGKAAVGIEVPNQQPQEVGFRDMLLAYQQCGKRFHIPILLGKAVNGDFVMNDLAKMPHCIIAGATGSGKSVCINTIVMSIVLNAKPDEIKLVMVDPKKVELTAYSRLPHMLAPVITEPHGAYAALNWLVKEMENRYEILKQIGVRNIEAFNARTVNKDLESSLNIEVPTKMHYIVCIIDELADLMMASNCDIETPIARIAQMARAVGIHLILATQRPSREVITGLIKANFPTRISFKVASRINSQIVLDETGAESLLGNGDMLFLPPGASHLVRAQGAFIRDDDINAVVKNICDQAPPNYVIESFDHIGCVDGSAIATDPDAPTDTLYEDAKDVILSTGNASTTFLQRKLKIGYARAASLMDQLELKGIVGPVDGSKPRKILAAKKGGAEEQDLFDNEEE